MLGDSLSPCVPAGLFPLRGQPLPLAEPASALCSLRGQPQHSQSSPLAGSASAPCGASLCPLLLAGSASASPVFAPCGASDCVACCHPLRGQPPSLAGSISLYPLRGQPLPLAEPASALCSLRGQPRHRQSSPSPLVGPAAAWPVATPCKASLLPLRVPSASTPCGAPWWDTPSITLHPCGCWVSCGCTPGMMSLSKLPWPRPCRVVISDPKCGINRLHPNVIGWSTDKSGIPLVGGVVCHFGRCAGSLLSRLTSWPTFARSLGQPEILRVQHGPPATWPTSGKQPISSPWIGQ